MARSHAGNRSPAQAPTQRTITIGAAGTRGLRTYVQLFVLMNASASCGLSVPSAWRSRAAMRASILSLVMAPKLVEGCDRSARPTTAR
ncbi:hypothetical protein BN9982_780021 [Mycobacterium tuberculosis]|nr:hypothetical protein BN9982_780021 [Mycobacterium tuberculosis]